ALAASLELRAGRELFASHGCSACHTTPSSDLRGSEPMPELLHGAPSLAGAGSRFSAEWLQQWILDPHALRPDAVMPRLLDAEQDESKQQAADLAAYLMTLVGEAVASPASQEADDELTEQGA